MWRQKPWPEFKMKEIILLILAFTVTGHTAQYAAEEAALIADIKSKSNPEARPEKTTRVTTNLELWDLNEIDIGKETMTLTGVIYAWWTDERLAWNNSAIKRVRLSAKHVWVPGLIIENEVTLGSDKVGSQGDREGSLVVYRHGLVEWGLRVITTLSCNIHIETYPFDKQNCSLVLADQIYTSDEVKLAAYHSNAIDCKFYGGNGEWKILKTDHKHDDHEHEGLMYRNVIFYLNLRRQPIFYILDIMFPLGLVSLLTTFVFLIPVQMKGEKIGYCIVVMLTYFVFLTIVSSQLPHISSQVSLIQVYILLGLLIGTLTTLATMFVLALSEEDDVPDVGVMKQIQFCVCRWFSCNCDTNKIEPKSHSAKNENQENGKKKHEKRNKEERREEKKKKEKNKLLLPKKVDKFFCYFFLVLVTLYYFGFSSVLLVKYF